MKLFMILLIALISIVSIQCGKNFEAEGDAAYQKKDYNSAISMYKQAMPEALNKEAIREKISLAFFYRGEELFNKTRNLKAFTGNFEQAEKYLPQYPNDNFTKEYSRTLYELGHAYSISKPQNDIEKDDYYTNSLNLLAEALILDSTNYAADSLIQKIQNDNFQQLLDTANKYYDRASRTGKVDLYLSSEYYLKKAAIFKSRDPGVVNLFRKIKKKTLAVLNYRDGVSLAISSYGPEKDGFGMHITIKNYLADSIRFEMSNFVLMSRDGIRYGVDDEAMRVRKLFGEELLENVTLTAQKSYTDGLVIFDAPEDTKVAYLVYQVNRRRESRKYFP